MNTKTILRNTTELKVGDIVLCHGGRFRLVAQTFTAEDAQQRADAMIRGARYYAEHNPARLAQLDAEIAEITERETYTRAFRSVYIGDETEGRECAIPRGWRSEPEGWTIQGNRRAVWEVEISEIEA